MTHDRHPIDHCVAVFDSIHRLFAYSLHRTVFIYYTVFACDRVIFSLHYPSLTHSLSLSLSLSLYSRSSLLFDVFRFIQNSVGISIVAQILIPILQVCVNSLTCPTVYTFPSFSICIYFDKLRLESVSNSVRIPTSILKLYFPFTRVHFTIVKHRRTVFFNTIRKSSRQTFERNIHDQMFSCTLRHTSPINRPPFTKLVFTPKSEPKKPSLSSDQ